MPGSYKEDLQPSAEPEAVARLGIRAGAISTESPFWHRRDPLVAVTRLDAGYRQIRKAFPRSWQPLLEVKSLLDAVASIQTSCAGHPVADHPAAMPLLLAAAEKLTQVYEAEAVGQRSVGTQALAAASRLRAYVQTGEWPLATLAGPEPADPWLYCGPLGTWAFRMCGTPISMLVVSPRPDMQAAPDAIDDGFREVQAAVERALGGTTTFVKPIRPVMQAVDMLMAGGELASGHKHFAHFYPLESPRAAVTGPEFTVVFANIHQRRLERCSLDLLSRYLGEACKPCSSKEITLASLSWFRAHDLGHFWRMEIIHDSGARDPAITDVERMTLEECYADVLGLITAAELLSPVPLAQAFTAEMLRYLSRDQSRFSDSAAAALTIGWLLDNGVTQPPGSASWLAAALPVLSELARVLHRVRWEARVAELPRLRAALQAGRKFRAGLAHLFLSAPTDLDYSFG